MAVRSGEVAFVRKLRAALTRSAQAEALSPRELARLESRVIRMARGTGRAPLVSPRFVALATAAAVCVVWFAVRRPAGPGAVPTAAAFALDGAHERAALRKLELDTLLQSLPGESIAPTPILVASFKHIEELSRVTIVGPGAPSLSPTARTGRRALRTEAGPADSPTEVILPVPQPARANLIHTISAWVLAQGGPVEVSLGSGSGDTAPLAGVQARQVDSGAWRWVTLTIPGAGVPLTEVRLRLTGSGPVLVDQVEAWCAGGSHGG